MNVKHLQTLQQVIGFLHGSGSFELVPAPQVERCQGQGKVVWDVCPAKGFASRYTTKDIRLLAEMDTLHDTPSEPAAKKLCERAYIYFNDRRFECLAGISAAHLYCLRKRSEYRKLRIVPKKHARSRM